VRAAFVTIVKLKSIICRHDQLRRTGANGANPPGIGAAPRMPAGKGAWFIMRSCGEFRNDQENNHA